MNVPGANAPSPPEKEKLTRTRSSFPSVSFTHSFNSWLADRRPHQDRPRVSRKWMESRSDVAPFFAFFALGRCAQLALAALSPRGPSCVPPKIQTNNSTTHTRTRTPHPHTPHPCSTKQVRHPVPVHHQGARPQQLWRLLEGLLERLQALVHPHLRRRRRPAAVAADVLLVHVRQVAARQGEAGAAGPVHPGGRRRLRHARAGRPVRDLRHSSAGRQGRRARVMTKNGESGAAFVGGGAAAASDEHKPLKNGDILCPFFTPQKHAPQT